MSPRRLFLALLLAGLLPGAALAQPRTYLAFGDSITEGVGDDPATGPRGYPPRLQTLLQNAGVDAVVENHGKGGERTPEGLMRINSVLDQGKAGDVLLLTEGTNDISRDLGIETTIFNLDEMATRAASRNIDTIFATVIPRRPDARFDPDNEMTDQLNGRIRNLAGLRQRRLSDSYEIFSTTPNLYQQYYDPANDDPVGHPNAAGYDRLARIWFNTIQGNDTVWPVHGITDPVDGETNVSPNTEIKVDVWDFGSGIDVANTFLLVNGVQVAATPTGNVRKVELRYQPPTPLSGTVSVGLRSQDLSNPPAVVDREILRFTVEGASTGGLQGDLNEDGRVDGADLVTFGRRFGSQAGDGNYDEAADFNNDDRVDGLDLAVLA
ncbi:MAG TPA: GDSL-type esterase/lipase family protein, partial [Thermoanaerobaculia bacterium]|nr:GDSL-type esterase/lipase family protein [Thermoanaerobaculia bacterium]